MDVLAIVQRGAVSMLITEGIRSVREQITERLRAEIFSGRLSEGRTASGGQLSEAIRRQPGHYSRGTRPPDAGRSAGSEAELRRQGRAFRSGFRPRVDRPDPSADRDVRLKHFFDDISEHDFHTWDSILHHLKRACKQKDASAIIHYDLAFHRSLCMRAGIPTLLTIWQTIVARIRRNFREATMNYGENLLEIYQATPTAR